MDDYTKWKFRKKTRVAICLSVIYVVNKDVKKRLVIRRLNTTEIGIINLNKKSLAISIKNAKCNYGHFRKVFPVAATNIN